jgi:hypothetical protein
VRAVAILGGFLVLADAMLGHAVDRPISGTKLVITRSSAGSEKLTFVSKDVGFLFPAIGGGDDPSAAGASVTVVSPLEPPVTLAIPPGVGNPGWSAKDRTTLDAYQFANGAAPAGPSVVRSARLREKRGIKIVARESGLALAAAQGSVGIRITTGTLRSCARFDAATIVVDQPNRFVAHGAIATSLADCSDASLGAPPICGDGVVEGTERCDGTVGCTVPATGVSGCFAPNSPNECQCCGQDGEICYQGGVYGPPVDCCPGLRCDYKFQIGRQGFGICTTSTCGGLASLCGGDDCCEGLVCMAPPGYPVDFCTYPTVTTTTTTSTTLPPVCGDGTVEGTEQCDGAACDPFLRNGCFPPGDALECQCCSTLQCYFGSFGVPLPCCPGLNCENDGNVPPGGDPGVGSCTTATCAALQHACAPGFLACCDGLVCAAPFGQPTPMPTYCLVPPGGACTTNAECVYPACVDGVCAGL